MTMVDDCDTASNFTFDQLDDQAKERAREWWREGVNVDFEIDTDDIVHIGKCLGIDIADDGRLRMYWSLHGQGSGASFVGHYAYHPNSYDEIVAHAPLDTELHDIAAQLCAIQAVHGRELSAKIGKHHHGHFLDIDAEIGFNDDGEICADADTHNALKTQLDRFCRWIHRQIECDYDYQMSDEVIDEALTGTDYVFDEEGNVV